MVSVCVATYNGEKYIKAQLESILCQLSENDEVIISDDTSTDSTLAIIQGMKDDRIIILHHKKNMRLSQYVAASFRFASHNFENAVSHAKGDFIYLADQDDVWVSNRISEMQSYLEQYDFVMCNYGVIDGQSQLTKSIFYSQNPVSSSLCKNILSTPFLGCCMAFKRSVLEYCLPFPYACIGHDYWMGCLILHLGTFKFIEKPLHLYRKHDTNVSPATGKSRNRFWFKVFYRLQFIIQIEKRSVKYKIKRSR